MEGLRIEVLREVDDLLAGECVRTQIPLETGLQRLEERGHDVAPTRTKPMPSMVSTSRPS